MICRLNFVTLEAKTQLKCVWHHKRTHDLTRKCRSACTSLSLVRHFGAYATLHSVNYKDSDQTGCTGSSEFSLSDCFRGSLSHISGRWHFSPFILSLLSPSVPSLLPAHFTHRPFTTYIPSLLSLIYFPTLLSHPNLISAPLSCFCAPRPPPHSQLLSLPDLLSWPSFYLFFSLFLPLTCGFPLCPLRPTNLIFCLPTHLLSHDVAPNSLKAIRQTTWVLQYYRTWRFRWEKGKNKDDYLILSLSNLGLNYTNSHWNCIIILSYM